MIFKTTKPHFTLLITFMLLIGLSGCSMTGGSADSGDSDASNEAARAEAEKEIETAMAKIPASSPLSKVELGMSDTRVRKLIGDPDDSTSYQTGKAWIPFYYGTDVARTDWLYDGQGRVVFSINRYSGQFKVINVMYDPDQK